LRGQFRCRGSRRESAVAQLSSLGGIELMKNTKRWIISIGIGAVGDAILLGLALLFSLDFFTRVFGATLGKGLALAALWAGLLLREIYPPDKSTLSNLFGYGCMIATAVIYSLIVYVLLRRKNAA